MTLLTHRIASVPFPTYVDLVVYLLVKNQISGFGSSVWPVWQGICSALADITFSFITPIFLHAGIIHFALNMIAQWFVSGQLERDMGSFGFFLVYFAAGIFG